MAIKKLKVMLIGAGKFGINYIRILKDLHEKGEVDFVGICVLTKASVTKLEVEHNITAFTDYLNLLPELDAVFVVTPPETHFKIISDCLPHVHVLSEKPLTLHSSEVEKLDLLATQNQKVLMTGQLFRFHAVTTELVKVISDDFMAMSPKQIKAVFVNPDDTYVDRPVAFEFIHWFDQVTYLFPSLLVQTIESVSSNHGRVKNVSVEYKNKEGPCVGKFMLGWNGEVKDRTFKIVYEKDTYISADYTTQTVTLCKSGVVTEFRIEERDALAEEISVFVSVIKGLISNPVTPESVLVSAKIAEKI